MRVLRLFVSGVALLVAAACCASPTAPSGAIGTGTLQIQVDGKNQLQVGEQSSMKATATFGDGSAQDVTKSATWISDNKNVCTINVNGIALGVGTGTCTVTAVVRDTTGDHPISVSLPNTPGNPNNPNDPNTPDNPQNPVGLVVQGATSVNIGGTTQWHAIAVFQNGSQQDVTGASVWSSSTPGVATVNGGGLVTGVAKGSAPIRASYKGLQGSGVILVNDGNSPAPTVTSLSVSGNSNISVGQTSQLTATAHFSDGSSQNVTGAATWSSGTAGVAGVVVGLVTGVSAGSSAITASYGGKSAGVNVNVTGSSTPTVNSLAVTGTSPLTVGQTSQYNAVANLSNGSSQNVNGQAQWNSSNTSVATVSSTGLVTAVAPGQTTISASYQGQNGSVPLTINSGGASTPDLIGLEVNIGVNLINVSSRGGTRTRATTPTTLDLGDLKPLIDNNHLLDLTVYGLYSDGSKQDVTNASTVNCDSIQTPSVASCVLGVDEGGTVAVVALLLQGLLNPNHQVNVTYGGYTANVNLHVNLPLLTGLGFPTNLGTVSLSNGNQLPPLTGVFDQGITSTVDNSLPTCTGNQTTNCVSYALTAAGPVANLLNTLGVDLNSLLSVTDGVAGINQDLLNSVLNNPVFQLLGLNGLLPLSMTAKVNNVTSNPLSIALH